MQRDDEFMSQLLIEARSRRGGHEGKISVTAVVTSQILLDVLDICGIPPQYNRQLMYAHGHSTKSFDFTIVNGDRLKTGGLNWPNSGVEKLSDMYMLMKKIEVPSVQLMKSLLLSVRQTPKMYTWANAPPELRAR
ncbi:Uu.00g030730.m01.CDS01 [Anthostomella pinea]|uniref:Uu.00g030730.m01.CDS01 n=1 Tax=Anthostomella pinea TaxID=933095 RepID=A0AAI8YCZ5_9PEZI|nr:Uu.00g030730.m01.CDS01 [Anthostomella pinea]